MIAGVDIVGALLRGNPDLLDLVPLERIKAGALPDDVPLPALLVRTVSSIERQPLKRGLVTRTVDRVSVTVRAANYRDQRDVIQLARSVCAGKTGTITGGGRVSILSAGMGPDLRGPGDSYEQAQDFKVSFDNSGGAAASDLNGPIEEMTASSSDGIALIGGFLRLDVDGLSSAP